MLVIISDLHLTDGTSGETIRASAFGAFRERLRDLAYDASWRRDGRYRPVEEVDIILLGDIYEALTFSAIPSPVNLSTSFTTFLPSLNCSRLSLEYVDEKPCPCWSLSFYP